MITDFVDARILGNCKKISFEHEVYTGHDKLGVEMPGPIFRLGLKQTFTGQYYKLIFPIDQRCDVKLN